MTVTFTHNENCRLTTRGSAHLPTVPIDLLCAMVTGQAARLFAGIRRRWTMRHIARFSTHRLQDIGFERDWDGSLMQISNGRVAGHLEH
ncbi:hypothetical protein [Rhizobium mesosinicum]|nr:hypothetical protein [Rhizobium mesosinicum]